MAPEDGGTKQMFNNLIESCTHKNELKRKSSFFFATIAVYALLLSAAGIASVVAYEAHLENQSLELVSLLTPVQPAKQEEPPERQQPTRSSSNRQQVATRTEPISRVADPTVVPDKPSSTPSNTPEIPENGRYKIGEINFDPVTQPGGPGDPNGNTSSTNSNGNVVVPETETTPPPVVKTEPKPPKPISKGVVNGIAISLPKPSYPQIAKTAGIKGQVTVQVLIDETGKVISATVLNGHPLLRNAAQQAALQARFNPTRLSEVPVKVNGIINYNFTF
jgi:protein TonB